MDFPGGSDSKASVYNAGDMGSIPGPGRSAGEGNGTPLQYYCLENPMDRGAWQAAVHGVTKSQTRLSDFTFLSFLSLNKAWNLVKNTSNAGGPGSIPGSGRSAGEGIGYPLQCSWVSLVAQLVKNLPAMWETCVQSLGWKDPLEKGKAFLFNFLR